MCIAIFMENIKHFESVHCKSIKHIPVQTDVFKPQLQRHRVAYSGKLTRTENQYNLLLSAFMPLEFRVDQVKLGNNKCIEWRVQLPRAYPFHVNNTYQHRQHNNEIVAACHLPAAERTEVQLTSARGSCANYNGHGDVDKHSTRWNMIDYYLLRTFRK